MLLMINIIIIIAVQEATISEMSKMKVNVLLYVVYKVVYHV